MDVAFRKPLDYFFLFDYFFFFCTVFFYHLFGVELAGYLWCPNYPFGFYFTVLHFGDGCLLWRFLICLSVPLKHGFLLLLL